MTAIRYLPSDRGTWLVIAAQNRMLILERQDTDASLDSLWAAVGPSGGVQSVLDELTRGGISQVPSFAMVSWAPEFETQGGPLSIIVRGEVKVVVHTASAITELDGSGVSTWNERVIPVAIGAEIRIGTVGEKDDTSLAQLALESGMAWATGVKIGELGIADTKQQPLAPAHRATTDNEEIPSETTMTEFTLPAEMHNESAEEHSDIASSDDSGYDFLFGETIARTVEDAAIRHEADDAFPEGGSMSRAGIQDVAVKGDHDGKTAIGLDRATRQAARRARAERLVAPPPTTGPRHFIDLSSGATEEISQPILIGRAPSVSKISGGNLPRLVTIAGTDQDISRNHVQVAVEGGTVVVTDLHSRNGTMVVLPGRPPQQLRAGQPTAIIPGTTVDLGAGVTFTVREG